MLAYLIVTGTLLLQRQQSLAQINSDGFNIYKGAYPDLLRSKSDEPYSLYEQNYDPALFVYRAPPMVVVSDGESGVEKRGVNHFKSFMMSPQREGEMTDEGNSEKQDTIYHFPRVVIKRAAPQETVEACKMPEWVIRLLNQPPSYDGSPSFFQTSENLNSRPLTAFGGNKE